MDNTKQTVLLIEDDEMILDIYSRILSKEFNLFTTDKVEEFYEIIKQNNIDCFLIDLSLGLQKSGLVLIKELRASEKYFNTPIIVITAHAFAKDERICVEAGATKFIRKPIENQRLLTEVNKVLQKGKMNSFKV
ncbi:MAG: response regulator [Ignavibacteriales bacterium]|nr:response regulator [Ignavibacteriales bacterium]